MFLPVFGESVEAKPVEVAAAVAAGNAVVLASPVVVWLPPTYRALGLQAAGRPWWRGRGGGPAVKYRCAVRTGGICGT